MKINAFKPGMPYLWLPPKLLFIMKLLTFIIFAAIMQVSAAGFSQINLNEKNASLIRVLESIKKQTGYVFLSKDYDLNHTRIDVNLKDASIEEALNVCFKNLPLAYKITDRTVFIQKKTPSFLDKVSDVIQSLSMDNIDVHGIVVDDQGNALAGATISVKGTNRKVITNASGEFVLNKVDEEAVLLISYLGYEPKEIGADKDLGTIKMILSTGKLDEVNVVSTGYQTLPKERATGSFVLIDSALLNRKVSTNILDRLDGVTSGLVFNKNNSVGVGVNNSAIGIRGRSTIFGDPNPLIVLDNFPYPGDINNINPNDIESITVLKDAAAASIWGTKAGNGVIVITTKTGHLNQKPTISFTSNLTIGQKPRLYTQPQLSSKEYIEVEQSLFDLGKFNSTITNGYGALSPAVEIMLLRRENQIDDIERSTMLDALSRYDIRDQQLKYLYRNPVNQQYQINIAGGSASQKYFVSGGYDKNLGDLVTTDNSRFTLNASNTYNLLNDKLTLFTGLLFTNSKSGFNDATFSPRYPYEHIADEQGQPLAVTDGTLGLKYAETAGDGKLLDWLYKPLEENKPNSTSNITDYRFNTTLTYKIINPLKVSVNYLYEKGLTEGEKHYGQDSYYVRNKINSFSQIDPATGVVTRSIPLGDILNSSAGNYRTNYGRAQLIYDQSFGLHTISGIAGFEINDYKNLNSDYILYGYDPETGTNLNQSIDFTRNYQYYYNTASSRILTGAANNGSIDRYRSFYTNISYSYNTKYTFSASARKDESNIFGVKANQKGVPLWSTGIAWELSKEDFYPLKFIPYLKLRATYGYNGNADKSTSAYLTAQVISGTNNWGNSYASISNPPNPSLLWERVRNVNLAIDFAGRGNRIKGSFEYYSKNGIDLIGKSPIAPQTGVNEYRGNSASLKTNGIDATIYTQNLTGQLKWNTAVLFSYVTEKVTEFKAIPGSNYDVVNGNWNNPLTGYPYNSIFSFKWAGLDATGAPKSYLGNEVSTDYTAIRNSADRTDIIYNGSGTPTLFGSVLNNFSYKAFELSFNITYKAGYYFRRSSLDNSILYNGGYMMRDYGLRWQKPGDELTTNVPSLTYPANLNRESIYNDSEALVEKGDHIRLQDVRLNYNFSRQTFAALPFKQLSLFVYVNNLGILWRANKYGIDPDSQGIAISRTFALGLRADL